MGHFLSTLAGVPLGNVLVNDVQATNINGSDCLTASIWVTGVDGMYVDVTCLTSGLNPEVTHMTVSVYSDTSL